MTKRIGSLSFWATGEESYRRGSSLCSPAGAHTQVLPYTHCFCSVVGALCESPVFSHSISLTPSCLRQSTSLVRGRFLVVAYGKVIAIYLAKLLIICYNGGWMWKLHFRCNFHPQIWDLGTNFRWKFVNDHCNDVEKQPNFTKFGCLKAEISAFVET